MSTDLPTLYQTQISLTEWFEKIGAKNVAAHKAEDTAKRERLKILNEVIGLPYDKPHQFPASTLAHPTPEFNLFLKQHGHELCALRLNPKDPSLPKLRMRGLTIAAAMDWFNQQKIDPSQYTADFVPHTTNEKWSTIFVISNTGLIAEVVQGGHHLLTQGFYDQAKPIVVTWDFHRWHSSPTSSAAIRHMKKIISYIKTTAKQQSLLTEKLKSEYVKDYIKGYFETVDSQDFGVNYIDYNRLLTLNSSTPVKTKTSPGNLKGRTGHPGQVAGVARIITAENLSTADFNRGEILICDMTTPDFIPLMTKAAAIVTERGGVLSHAAIVARELQVPCIVACANILSEVKDRDFIEIDADRGLVFTNK